MRASTSAELVLGPGDFYFGSGPERIRTLLGSCVAVTVWHPKLRLAGMCHYLVPGVPADEDPRYAYGAMARFLAGMREAGTSPADYQAKMFGGGAQFGFAGVHRAIDVAGLNVAIGQELMSEYGIPVTARQVGGRGPREVILDRGTGDVWVRHKRRTGGDVW